MWTSTYVGHPRVYVCVLRPKHSRHTHTQELKKVWLLQKYHLLFFNGYPGIYVQGYGFLFVVMQNFLLFAVSIIYVPVESSVVWLNISGLEAIIIIYYTIRCCGDLSINVLDTLIKYLDSSPADSNVVIAYGNEIY